MFLSLEGEGYIRVYFQALGGPCEALIDADDKPEVRSALMAVADEVWRIEDKFSRYKPTGVVHQVNSANGEEIQLDDESSGLIDYADTCHRLSGGSFDITSGVLRRVWRFDGSKALPARKAVDKVLAHVGWHKVRWQKPCLRLRAGMEIDLGGIGKEYAVDRAALLLEHLGFKASLVNFGGDLRVNGPRRNGDPWMIGIDNPRDTGPDYLDGRPIASGAMATSGDARRFILAKGRRYGHILDPRTGWPVRDAPRSVTVQAPTCLEAGMLATFGILKGADAEQFFQSQGVPHLVIR
ncbi:MAG: FAD:protein FMN transferase [Sulfurimicrobium sp.]|nr:FAD:protein FMN transferase [Sulfurimicrobium sp.]